MSALRSCPNYTVKTAALPALRRSQKFGRQSLRLVRALHPFYGRVALEPHHLFFVEHHVAADEIGLRVCQTFGPQYVVFEGPVANHIQRRTFPAVSLAYSSYFVDKAFLKHF